MIFLFIHIIFQNAYVIHILKYAHAQIVVFFKMASNLCVEKALFYEQLDKKKASTRHHESKISFYIEDDFYERAKNWLQSDNGNQELTNNEKAALKRKGWRVERLSGKIVNKNNKLIIPKKNLHKVLCQSHSATAHRGRDKTLSYVRRQYAEISQAIV